MALTSPGVEVSVINESFYVPSDAGTTPLFIVASSQDKQNGAGDGTAAGTQTANANTAYLISSQRELTETFGDPKFYTDASGNPLNGYELNEYGLQAAYSFLGVANRAYVLRSNLDVSNLTGSAIAPTSNAVVVKSSMACSAFLKCRGAVTKTIRVCVQMTSVPYSSRTIGVS